MRFNKRSYKIYTNILFIKDLLKFARKYIDMTDRLDINTLELSEKFVYAKKMLENKEHAYIQNCKYLRKSGNFKRGDENPSLIYDRAKAIDYCMNLLHEINKIIFYGDRKEFVIRADNTIDACKELIQGIFSNGGFIDSNDYLLMQNKYNLVPWNVTEFLVNKAYEYVESKSCIITDEVRDVFKSIFGSLYKTSSISGGKGVGHYEILMSTCFIGATKPKKGDVLIDDGINHVSLELKGKQGRILAESYMMSSGYKGINKKLRKKFPNDTQCDIDYINNPEELFKLPLECRKYFLDLFKHSWDDKDGKIQRSDIVECIIDKLSPNIFADYDNVIFKDTRAYDDLLMLTSLGMYLEQDDFDILVLSVLDCDGNIWELAVPAVDIKNMNKIYDVWHRNIYYESSYADNGRFRVKQTTLRIKKDL